MSHHTAQHTVDLLKETGTETIKFDSLKNIEAE